MTPLVRKLAVAAGLASLVPALLVSQGAPAAGEPATAAVGAAGGLVGLAGEHSESNESSQQPYMGWSSWSLQATNYPGVNPQGRYSWLNEDNLLAQVDVMAEDLKQYGYEYINLDAGWWSDWNWTPGFDEYARPKPNAERFPSGMEYVSDYIHDRGLKMGLYLPIGMDRTAYNGGNSPIWGAPGCTTADVVYDDLRPTNGFGPQGSAYAMDFSDPCARAYIDSLVALFTDWDVDFLKLDGVGPGSGRNPAVHGENYNNIPDVAAWREAFDRTGRDVHLLVSWSMNHDYVDAWQRYTDSWRVGFDVECYCSTMTTWQASSRSLNSVIPWTADAGPELGWNNLDSLNVGVGEMDGLTQQERRTIFTFWAVAAAPLYLGDDLTRLDDFGLSLITDTDVIAINQQGIPAQPVDTSTAQEVWFIDNPGASYTVALFNFSAETADVTANFTDLGFRGLANVDDVWAGEHVEVAEDSYTATLPGHGTQLLTITPLRR